MPLPTQHVQINATVNGDNVIVPAIIGHKIVVVSYKFAPQAAPGAAWSATWNSQASGPVNTPICGPIGFGVANLPAGDGATENQSGWFVTRPGEALVLTTSVPVGGCLSYYAQ